MRNARLIQLSQGNSQPILDMALLFSPFVQTHSPPPAPCTLSQNLAPTDVSEVTSEAESLLVIKQLT